MGLVWEEWACTGYLCVIDTQILLVSVVALRSVFLAVALLWVVLLCYCGVLMVR
jgi:hypothetical protein